MSDNLICKNCEHEVTGDSEFCPNCGSMFIDADCSNHPDAAAEGVCVICSEPLCSDCLGRTKDIYLCVEHTNYEIYQGMARVYGTSDELEAGYAEDCLKKDGLHPFLFYRKVSPIAMGDPSYSLFRSSGEFDGHIINEIKLMIPLFEVIKAEEILKNLEIID